MEMKGIIDNWFEEGFLRFKEAPPVQSRYEKSLIPHVTNDKGELVTPRPLFPMFLKTSSLDPNFLVEYLEVIENALLHGRDKDIQPHVKDAKDISEIDKKMLIEIEYDRKNIFLSRVIFSLFELPDHLVPKGSPDYDKVQEKNDLYKKAVEFRKESIENSDDLCTQAGYVERVDKKDETVPIIFKDKETVVNAFEMREHYNRKEIFVKPPPKTIREYLASRTKFRNSEEFITNLDEYPAVIKRMNNSLYVIEKTLHYNTYKNTLMSYNGSETNVEDVFEISEARSSQSQVPQKMDLKHHLRFHIPSMKSNYRVTCIACNPKNPSIFLSGHGVTPSEEMDCSPPGYVLCWNVNKCENPERIYHTQEVVTCLEFSKTKPYLLAVGMRYGLISVFDLRRSETHTHADNSLSKVRPSGTITSVRWMRKKYSLAGEAEVILSTSMDGLITTWHHGRTLLGIILRATRRGVSQEKSLNRLILAPDAAPLCMQVNPNEQEVFLVGTIEGQVLQMNFNTPEDYMRVYDCHNGPLYDIQWSPVVQNVFATCATDGSLRVWQVGRVKSCRVVHLKNQVLKIALSNVRSTLFAVLMKKVLLVFDFSVNLHKPIAELLPEQDLSFTSIAFCPRNNWILVGRSDGVVNLYELTGIPELKMSQSEALLTTFLPE